MSIEFHGRSALVDVGDVAFTFESTENPRELAKYQKPQDNLDWTKGEYQIGSYRVRPYGANNDLPKTIKDIVQNNSIAPGILKKKLQLLWGKGPQLYTEDIVDNKLVRTWVKNTKVQKWLDSWSYLDYLQKSIVDYTNIEGTFTKFYLSKGIRVNKPSIAKLEFVSAEEARLGNHINDLSSKPQVCILTDWYFRRIESLDYKVYGLFDFQNPFKHRNSILYSNMYSFCSDYYTIPDIYGSLEWIKRSSAIPLILKALSKNSINLKYHIISPEKFWTKKAKELKDRHGEKYTEQHLINYKKDYLRQVSKVLSGAENTGKFWHSIKYIEIDGHKIIEEGWEIKEIKQNIRDYVEAQLKISDQANRMTSGSLGLRSAIGGAEESGGQSSGADQLYALKNFLLTGVDIPESIVMKAINYSLMINFPGENLKLGFYHLPPEREEDVTESKRMKNNVS